MAETFQNTFGLQANLVMSLHILLHILRHILHLIHLMICVLKDITVGALFQQVLCVQTDWDSRSKGGSTAGPVLIKMEDSITLTNAELQECEKLLIRPDLSNWDIFNWPKICFINLTVLLVYKKTSFRLAYCSCLAWYTFNFLSFN